MQYYSRFRAVYVFDETRPFFYYFVGPGQQPMQYYLSFGGVSVFDETNNHYPMPGLNVVIILYKLALLPTPSIDKAFR